MEQLFLLHSMTRNSLLKLGQSFSTEQLNHIPKGFSNNIIWNLGHVVVTQQLLIYKLSGNKVLIEQSLVERFRKGSKPEGFISTQEIEMILDLLTSTSIKCKKDFEVGIFTGYNQYQTSFGYEINSIIDAIAFNNLHEAMHLGNIQVMKKVLQAYTQA